MKTTTLALTLGTLISSLSYAQTCTTTALATIANIRQCPKNIREEIWLKVAKPATVADLGNKIFITDKSGKLDSQTEWSNLSYISAKDGKVCVTTAYPHSTYSSVAENGVLGITSGTAKCQDKEAYRIDRLRVWKGMIVSTEYFGSEYTVVENKPVYPLTRSEAENIIHNSSSYFWQKTDALASVIKDMPAPSQGTIVMDLLNDLSVRSSADALGIYKKLVSLNDPRSNNILIDLLNDGIVMDGVKNAALKEGANGTPSAELLEHVKNELSRTNCTDGINESLVPYGKFDNKAVKNAQIALLSRCASYSNQYFYYWFTTVMKQIAVDKNAAGTLPIMELLNNYATAEMPKNVAPEYKTMMISGLNALGAIGSDRALATLKNSFYYDNIHSDVAQAARNAVKAIESAAQIKKITLGNAAAIKWGMDIISYNNGSARELQFQILEAFTKAMKINAATKARIKTFLKNEIEQGYHAYDEEFVSKMESLLKL